MNQNLGLCNQVKNKVFLSISRLLLLHKLTPLSSHKFVSKSSNSCCIFLGDFLNLALDRTIDRAETIISICAAFVHGNFVIQNENKK
jgi:hypothetical protein